MMQGPTFIRQQDNVGHSYSMRKSTQGVKDEARRLVDSLPEDADWDDVMQRIYVRQCIGAGIADADADAGRVVLVDEVRRRFGLAP